MGINLVGGRDVGSSIRYRLVDSDATMFDDDELNSHLSWSVSEYSNYRPQTASYSFNTTIGLQSYALPSDFVALVGHNYSNQGDLTITDVDQLDWLYLTGLLRDDTMRFIRDETKGRWEALTKGDIQIINNTYMLISPIPNAVMGISIQYETAHVINGNNWNTISAQDAQILIDLTVARCLEIEVDEMLRQGDWKAGQTEVKRREQTLLDRASRLRESVINKLTSTSLIAMQ